MKTLNLVSGYASKYFAVWVILISAIAFLSPSSFAWIGAYINILLGLLMFGMGATLNLSDFKIVFKKPAPVFLGVIAQFVIMPTVAFLIALALNLPPAVAAGLVLVGSVPGGTTSNIMVYLSKGDLPLSVFMTSVSTMLSPLLTPLLLLIFAGQWLPVEPISMFLSIIQVIIIPVGLGLMINQFFPTAIENSKDAIPLVSVIATMAIIGAVVALNNDIVATTGLMVILAVMLHNMFGLMFGYFVAKLLGIDESRRRAIAIEVGMQNSGLASSLAVTYFSPVTALPSAIFSIWHNISGPILASFWSQRPVKNEVEVIESRKFTESGL